MKILKVLQLASIIACTLYEVQAQTEWSVRKTHNNSDVVVFREENPAFLMFNPARDARRLQDQERDYQRRLPEAELLVPGAQFRYRRNCHDYAWAPFMDCMCNTTGTQKEAWWMGATDSAIAVNQNWLDGSMEYIIGSVRPPIDPGDDYLFNTEDLNWIPLLYYDILVQMIPLPTCPLDSPTEIPVHSAILVDWFTPPGTPSEYSVGIFISKWGDLGIFRHRWGDGYSPPEYNLNTQLRIFAPKQPQWPSPYYVFHTPWGF